MDPIHYLFTPLILFHVPYTLELLPYYLLIANGTGGVGIFELLVFSVLYKSYQVNNKVIDVLYILKGGGMEKFILSLLCKYLVWMV